MSYKHYANVTILCYYYYSGSVVGATSVDVPGMLYGRQVSSGSGPLSIPALIAAGSSSATRQQDSDDDYD